MAGSKVHVAGSDPFGPVTDWRLIKVRSDVSEPGPIPAVIRGRVDGSDEEPVYELLADCTWTPPEAQVATVEFMEDRPLPELDNLLAVQVWGGATTADGVRVWSTPVLMVVFDRCFEDFEGAVGVPADQTMGGGCEFGQYFGAAHKTSRPGFDPWQCKSDPVNTASGALMAQQVDVVLPAPGKTTEWARTYNSNDSRVGMFGTGWAS